MSVLAKLLREALFRAGKQAERVEVDAPSALAQAADCLGSGRSDQAQSLCMRVLDREPANVEAHHLLGTIMAQRGEYEPAAQSLRRALASDPHRVDAWVDLASVLQLGDSRAESLACYARALEIDPRHVLAACGESQLLAQTGREKEAIGKLQERIVLDYDPLLLRTLVALLAEHGQFDSEEWLRLEHPAVADKILRALIDLLDRLGRQEQAQAACESILRRAPDQPQAHASLGFLRVKRAFDPASGLRHLNVALAHRPDDPSLHVTRSIALRDLARIDEAIEACDRALSLDEGNPMARFHRAIARLLGRDFGRGWPDYEARLESEAQPKRAFPYPRWSGEDLAGRTILVHSEQGIGDEIMFAGCIPDLVTRGARVVLECSPKLEKLFTRSFPAVSVNADPQFEHASWPPQIPIPHFVAPIGSLPLHFRQDEQAFDGGKVYLRADAQLTQAYRRRIEALGPGLSIGLSWRGGTIATRRAIRSIDPSELFPALDLPGLHWVSLQYDASAAEVERLGHACGLRIHHWQDAIDDYDATAALVNALDLVISVCTSIVHLGGALGRPVWVAAHHSPEWRYGVEGETMPWYGSVRIVRQRVAGEWADVIERMVQGLREFCPEPGARNHASV